MITTEKITSTLHAAGFPALIQTRRQLRPGYICKDFRRSLGLIGVDTSCIIDSHAGIATALVDAGIKIEDEPSRGLIKVFTEANR